MGASSAGDPVDADVVIVGAGIAGTTLGYLLARSGVDTVLLERHTDLSREFRGFGFQPLALRYFDAMGVLEDVYDLDPVRIDEPHVNAFGTRYAVADVGVISPEYDHVLFMEQPPLLSLFVERANASDHFEYLDGTPVTDLLWDEDQITGVEANDRTANETAEIYARAVVACDGRFSTIRNVLDLDPNRFESDVELVWVKLPEATSSDLADVYVNEHGAMANFGLPGGEVQLGLVIEAGSYPEIRDRGIEPFRDRLAAIAPKYETQLGEHLAGFDQCSLLEVAPGITEEWTHNGLVLAGDAAHIASPFGGQGNLMALKDAVALHPILVEALREQKGNEPLTAESLAAFERERRPAVEKTVSIQRRLGGGVGWMAGNFDALPPWAFRVLFRTLFTVATPVMRSNVRHLLLGSDPPPVRQGLFTDTSGDAEASVSEATDRS